MKRRNLDLARARDTIDRVLAPAQTGTLLDLAVDHAEAWAALPVPAHGWERGGSSAPSEIEERQEVVRVARMAVKATARIPEILDEIGRLAIELYDTTQKLTAVTHPDNYPLDSVIGCRSCARTERIGRIQIGGFFAPVYEKSKKSGLCRWCWDYEHANGEPPPVRAIELYHTQGPRAAGVFLAKAS